MYKEMERVKKDVMKKERKRKRRRKRRRNIFFGFGRKNCEKRRKNKTRDL